MNPDSPQTPREEQEMRLTALLLDELSAEETASLRKLMEHDPELRLMHERLKQTIGLVREAAGSGEGDKLEQTLVLRLSTERREKLLPVFKTGPLKKTVKSRRKLAVSSDWLKMAAMVAALLGLAGLVLSNIHAPAKSWAQRKTPEDILF